MAQTETSGLFEALLWGASNPPTTSAGIVEGGDISSGSELRIRQGIGGTERRSDGLVKFGGTADFYLSNTNLALVQKAQRAAYPRGALTAIYIEGGADSWSLVYGDAYIRTLKLALDEGGAVKASIDWIALSIADGDGLTMADETADIFEDFEFVATIEGNEYGVLSWALNLDNKMGDPKTNQDAKTSGAYRWPQFVLRGLEELSVDVTCGRPIPRATLDLWEDYTPEDIDIVLTGNNGTHTCTITLANLKPSKPEGLGLVAVDSQAVWTYGFRAKSTASSLTITIA